MITRSRLLLGVDTGGTYTDAVLIDASTLEVVASAKALTTRGNLAIGVSNAVDAISEGLDPTAVQLVSVSTTLATNAVVEGHGSPVLALLVGFDDAMIARSGVASAFRDVVIERIDGGHDHYGVERAPLDRERAAAALDAHADSVHAVAITSAFAVRNSAHEDELRELVLHTTDLPVTISTELSDALDAPRRALTTVLNARLLSRISGLIDAVHESLATREISAPLTIAKGDGSLAIAEAVARRPIETILSGPAASMVGAAAISGLSDFIMSDMGGTTTDVGLVSNGRPRLDERGALVGGWRTMVRAIDIRTTGLGGDSEVYTDRRDITIGPGRHVPLALLAAEEPEIVPMLEADLADHPPREYAGQFVMLPAGGSPPEPRSGIEARVLARLGPAPARLREIAPGSVERRSLVSMAQRGVVQIGGFTPSDAAHVLGLQANWSGRGARLGAELLSWYTAEDPTEFSRRVWSETVRRSAIAALEVAFDGTLGAPGVDALVDAASSGAGVLGRVEVRLEPTDPIVAVGGPAGVYYPEVARRLRARLVLADDHAVANAIGAASGRLIATAETEVTYDGPGTYRVVGAAHVEVFSEPTPAIERATDLAQQLARDLLMELAEGLPAVGDTVLHTDVVRHDDPASVDDDGLYAMRIHAEASARPYAADAAL